MENKNKVLVTAAPHIRDTSSSKRRMLDVIIALVPASVAGMIFFGFRAVLVILFAILSAVVAEWAFNKMVKKPDTTKDLSAIVTGLLLGMTLPSSAPLWVPVVGSFFAIIIVKQLFGGLGQNFVNPALAARAFLQIAYPVQLSQFFAPLSADAVSTATPLSYLGYADFAPSMQQHMDSFFGITGGAIGETSALLLLIGAGYLFFRKVISWRIPVAFLAAFLVMTAIFGRHGLFTGFPLYELLIGGLMLAAFFMATDYSSSPITPKGKIIFGMGCGLLTAMIRIFGGYPEGAKYAILLMNMAVPLIEQFTRPRVFGTVKEAKN